jgi:hypothetical protein
MTKKKSCFFFINEISFGVREGYRGSDLNKRNNIFIDRIAQEFKRIKNLTATNFTSIMHFIDKLSVILVRMHTYIICMIWRSTPWFEITLY